MTSPRASILLLSSLFVSFTCGGIAVIDDAASSSTSGSTAASTTGAGGCASGFDTPCELCGATKCSVETDDCAALSACDARGEPVAGCLAFVACVLANCPGSSHPICIAQNCEDEFESAGGPMGEGTMSAQQLGVCLQSNCGPRCGF